MNLFKSTKATTYISSRGDKVYPIIMDIKTGIVEGDAVFTTGDIDTAYLYATILEEQSDYNILGSTVICNIQRPDGTTMKVQGDVLGNNLIEFPLGQSGVSQEGIYNFDIAVVFSEKKMVTSPTAQYSVTQSIEVNGEIEEDDRFPVLESLISGMNVINEEELVRVSNEEVRQAKEEAREQAESVRARNEETRLANNEAIRNEEAVRVVNENERKNAESLRVQEENKRKQQENTRIAQENTRVSQETARVNAENTRKNQEATRQASEATRVSQETNRSQAESTRNSNETVRQNQENTRKNQEQARVTAEGNRVTSENVRVSAEQARVLKEQERQAIEVERQTSESTREQQEATRVSQENARKQADILRQQEHESRQQFLDGFEGKLNTVVDDVATVKDDVVAVREANKRQDVFLQGLYNENLDGRVTVKEEGSVISLTNSDNGLVDIVGLEGNTLVNYCTDGVKELTLNGDIDIEGTSVTLTDTVDNGLVDVVCEGNTLVNLISKEPPYMLETEKRRSINKELIKANTVYTVILPNNISESAMLHYAKREALDSWHSNGNVYFKNGVGNFKTPESMSDCVLSAIKFINTTTTTLEDLNKCIILEGDYTNKPIPSYFEGMKSVGECEDNKIEIISRNKNLFDGELELGSISTSHGGNITNSRCLRSKNYIKVRPNTTIIQSNDLGYESVIYIYDKDKNLIEYLGIKNSFTIPGNGEYIRFRSSTGNSENNLNVKYQLEEGNVATSYVPHSNNKKEITLSEPLRGLPNGVKDKIVKIDGKWYIQRNTGQILLNGDSNEKWVFEPDWTSNSGELSRFLISIPNQKHILWHDLIRESKNYSINNRFNALENIAETFALEVEHFTGWDFGKFVLNIKTSRLSIKNELGLKQWLSENPIELVYELETPIYEELPIDPTLNTYNDITRISSNSTIPCNMTVKNTGYRTIIKPSTQYTVAFDTNISGEVGINLAGSKVTTTNNVATVTTSATLTDDSLRLYGKGIKANRVRLLESDKTNWIPSYFEGMKSCFENKEQDNGSYEVEIVSSNQNLIKNEYIQNGFSTKIFSVEPNTEYYVYTDTRMDNQAYCWLHEYDANGTKITNGVNLWSGKFTTKPNTCKIHLNSPVTFTDTLVLSKYPIEKYIPHKSNLIQLQLNEPLRGVGDVKDRFVFKDGKLMIERNFKQLTVKDSMVNNIYKNSETEKTIAFRFGSMIYPNWQSVASTSRSNLLYKIGSVIYDKEGYSAGDTGSDFYIRIDKCKLDELSVNGMRKWLRDNEVVLTYQLIEPLYEEIPFELQKIILEGYENGTLFFDTNIPPTVEASYTANIPVVSKLNKVNETTETNTEDIAITQMAVDFLLMSNLGEEMLSSFNLNTRGRNGMGAYFANRITKGALKYEDVISKYPQYKEEIDSILETK